MSDRLTCSICTGELSINNVVNTECKHPTCKTCFWRWAKDKNTCPFCREHLLKNDEEAKDIQLMREILTHRTDIVRQVEEAYEEQEDITSSIRRKQTILCTLNDSVDIVERKIKILEQSHGGKYKTYKYFKTLMTEKRRRNRFGVSCDLVFSNYNKVVSDIKGLSKHSPSFQFRHLQPQDLAYRLFFHVRCMERKRKERRKRKKDNLLLWITGNDGLHDLATLFSQDECITDSSSDMDIDLAYDPRGESLIDDPNIISELDEISNWTPSNWNPHLLMTPPQSPHTPVYFPPPLVRARGVSNVWGRRNLPIRNNLINSGAVEQYDIFRDMVMQVIQEEDQLSNVD